MYCKYLAIRSKNYQKYKFCRLTKQVIHNDCESCLNFNLRPNKGIKKVSSKRVTVTKETYNLVYSRDNGRCRLCGSNLVELHHIYYRSERKDLINNPSNCILLCPMCHRLVHSNKHKYQPLLLKLIEELERS